MGDRFESEGLSVTAQLSEKVLGDFARLSVFIYGPRGAAVKELPPRCRQVVMMRKTERLSRELRSPNRWALPSRRVEDRMAKEMRLLAQASSGRCGALASGACRHDFFRTFHHVGSGR
jgi:hypothetical protein